MGVREYGGRQARKIIICSVIPIRLYFGTKGNLTEEEAPLGISLGITVGTVLLPRPAVLKGSLLPASIRTTPGSARALLLPPRLRPLLGRGSTGQVKAVQRDPGSPGSAARLENDAPREQPWHGALQPGNRLSRQQPGARGSVSSRS
ncbi:transmembrane protein 80 [Crotalus adamanteus]|uniref:Transmembrane protein 80 n=1 Tax=Crotalus adamanteus TaxID=8729 RepID=A0AAW1C736_CROAD